MSGVRRFQLTKHEKLMKDLGPGIYNARRNTTALYKYKPSAAFANKGPKDSFAAALSQKLYGKRSFSMSNLKRNKGDLGVVNQILDFNDAKAGKAVYPDFTYGTNPGPGSYDLAIKESVNPNKAQGYNETFNSTTERFDAPEKNTARTGPGAYDHMKADYIFKKAKTSYNKFIHQIPFQKLQPKGWDASTGVPPPGAYSPAPGFSKLTNQKSMVSKICAPLHTPHSQKFTSPIAQPLIPSDWKELGPGCYQDMHSTLKLHPTKPTAPFTSKTLNR